MSPADRPDADDLVVRAALGERLSEEERRRLDADPELREQVAHYADVVDLARTAPATDEVGSSGLEHLWDGIAAEAFADEDGPAAPAPATDHDDAPSADVIPLRPRTAVWATLSAVAAAAVAVVALVTVGPLAGDDPRPVAAADLQPFGDADVDAVEGDFVLADGSARLRLDLSSLPAAEDAFYEVWLLDAEQGRLVSLGPVRDDNTYALPAGTPVDAFPLVDVSVEPLDGDPTHSGDSVLRGPVQVTT